MFAGTTAVLNLLAWLAALIGTVIGLQWLAFAGWIGVLTVTGWTLYTSRRAGHDLFPDLREGLDLREHEGPPEPKT